MPIGMDLAFYGISSDAPFFFSCQINIAQASARSVVATGANSPRATRRLIGAAAIVAGYGAGRTLGASFGN